jgi:hypothetical protein
VEVEVTAVEEDSTAAVAADSTEVAEQRSMEEGVLAAEAAPRTLAEARTADIVAATMVGAAITEVEVTTEGGATTVVAAVTAGATAGVAGMGAEDMVTDGVGELASGGRIGDGDIRMPPITVPGITGLTLIILTRATVPRTIPMAIRILTTETTILPRQIPTHGRSRTRADLQEPGDLRCLEGHPTRATQTAAQRREGQFYPLTR